MKVIIKKDYEQMSLVASQIVAKEVKKKPDLVLGLATGSTPIGMYKNLISMNKKGEVDFSRVKTFNLDEYVGLDERNPTSYHCFMKEEFFNHINIREENTNIPDGNAKNITKYCKEYDERIAQEGGIDVQILGIGENGHIAFNEPDEQLSMGTTVVKLTESTIKVNSRFFDSIEDVPKTAITMGIGSIMKAKKIILLASGKRKRDIMNKILKSGKISTKIPASLLMLHRDVTFILDEDAYDG